MPRKPRKKKRKCSAAQLKALKRGRAIRKKKLKGKRPRKTTKTRKNPMAKRRRTTGGHLTGGTKDVNPQYMHGELILSATDAITEAAFNTPVVRIPGAASRVTLMEVLKIFWFPHQPNNTSPADQWNIQTVTFSTIPQGIAAIPGYNEPNIFCQMKASKEMSFTALGTGYCYSPMYPFMTDLTDGAGHGFLIATDRIYVQGDSQGMTPSVAHFPWKILYRFKTVGITEYVGIVQSQQ